MNMLRVAIIGLAVALPGVARADPCTRIPDRGPMPDALRHGAVFSGSVVYVGDGDSLCVAVGPRRGADWVEVRLADFNAPELNAPGGREARERLIRLTMGRRLDCIADHRSWDRVVAACRLDGAPLGDVLRRDGGREGGR